VTSAAFPDERVACRRPGPGWLCRDDRASQPIRRWGLHSPGAGILRLVCRLRRLGGASRDDRRGTGSRRPRATRM